MLENIIHYRFDENCNIQFTVNNLEELTDEQILKFVIEHDLKQRPRLDELDDYYQSKNRRILQRENRKEGLANNRIAHPVARYVSAFIQGYLVGNAIKVMHKDEKANESIQELNRINGLDKLNADLVLDQSIYGRAYDIVSRNKNDEDRVYLLSPLFTFVIYDNSIERNPVMGIRYRKSKDSKYEVDCYTSDEIVNYIQEDLTLKEVNKAPHYYGEVPITEYSNNRFRQGDFEPILDLIDAYDSAQSDTANYMTDFNDALLLIKGHLATDKTDEMKNSRILFLEEGIDQDGKPVGNSDAKYIYKQYDVQGSESYKDRIASDIHKYTNTPDMNDEKFSGNVSGESMKYKLFGLEQVRATKQTLFTDSALRRYRLIFNIKDTAEELKDVNISDLEFKFTPNIPRSTQEEIKNFIELGGELSQETILNLTALVKNAKDEMDLIAKERENSTTLDSAIRDRFNTTSDKELNPNQGIEDGQEE